jgi:GH25 family lysozyme M1 (1,4-beta-N-acetylmuramidase)
VITWLLDISNYTDPFDAVWAALQGYSMVICKTSEGMVCQNAWFDRYIPAVRTAGLLPGAYHVLRRGAGTSQARVFHSRITAHHGPPGWFLALVEPEDATREDVRAFTDEWHRISADQPLVLYTHSTSWRTPGWDGAALPADPRHAWKLTGSLLRSRSEAA